MSLFGSKEPENEQQKFLRKYGLENLTPADLVILKRITADIAGNKWFKTGMALGFAKSEEQAKVTYLSALVEQNWLIIRKLDEISKRLGKEVSNKEVLGEDFGKEARSQEDLDLEAFDKKATI